jgi:hypothetical protein
VSVGERRALFERGRANAREKIVKGAVLDHVPAGRAFERDVVFDDEPLVASTNLLDEAEIAEKERLAEAPVAVREPLGEAASAHSTKHFRVNGGSQARRIHRFASPISSQVATGSAGFHLALTAPSRSSGADSARRSRAGAAGRSSSRHSPPSGRDRANLLAMAVGRPAEVPAVRALLDRPVGECVDEPLARHQMMPPSTSPDTIVFVPQASHHPRS